MSETTTPTPIRLNFQPTTNKMVVHFPPVAETTKSGIHLSASDRKKANEQRLKDSTPYYLLALPEDYEGKLRVGDWIYLDAGAMAQQMRIGEAEVLVVNTWDFVGKPLYHDDRETEALYELPDNLPAPCGPNCNCEEGEKNVELSNRLNELEKLTAGSRVYGPAGIAPNGSVIYATKTEAPQTAKFDGTGNVYHDAERTSNFHPDNREVL